MSVRRSPRVRGGRNWIVVAADLSPADVIEMSRRGYAGFVTESGGGNSHAAILARSIGMPGVSGVADATRKIATGDSLIVDSDAGAVVVRPDAETRRRFLDSARQPPPPAAARKQRARTIDGETVRLHANIEIPDEAPEALAAGSDGVGLFRTEFLFFEPRRFARRRGAVSGLSRGAQKNVAAAGRFFARSIWAPTKCRAPIPKSRRLSKPRRKIRLWACARSGFALAAPRLFARQARAILRAARFGRARILLPMLSAPAELTRARDLIAAAAEQAFESESRARPLPPIGAMIEVPAAVFVMRAFARRLDFFFGRQQRFNPIRARRRPRRRETRRSVRPAASGDFAAFDSHRRQRAARAQAADRVRRNRRRSRFGGDARGDGNPRFVDEYLRVGGGARAHSPNRRRRAQKTARPPARGGNAGSGAGCFRKAIRWRVMIRWRVIFFARLTKATKPKSRTKIRRKN